MIAPLRRRHRWLAPASFAVAATGLLLGVRARPKAFIDEGSGRNSVLEAPAEAAAAARPVAGIEGLRAGVVGERDVWLIADARLEAADVLVYLGSEAAEGSLPGDALLLGSAAPLGASRFTLPAAPPENLILFSLGQQRILGTTSLQAINQRAR